MIQVEIAEAIQFDQGDALASAAAAALERVPEKLPVGLTIALEGDDVLHKLNREYRGIDETTDVLSFPAEEYDPDSQSWYIGDIIISLPQAERQALAAGHSAINELRLLVVHGVLHLLGYDHHDEEQKRIMWQAQAEILAEIGCEIKNLPE